MQVWRSAELVLFDPEAPGPGCHPFLIEPLNTGRRRVTAELHESGEMHRPGRAAFYRCQAPDPDCQCSSCWRERWLASHPKAPQPKPLPEPIRVDSRGVRWYPLNVPDDQMR